MNKLDRIRRNFRDTSYLASLKRGYDDRPMQCSLYVTDQCNLDCAYCTEYDNERPHPKLDDIKAWLRHIRALGTLRVALVGGEPMLHPDIVEITRYAKELGLATSLTTNGYRLNEKRIRALEEAGLDVMQISVDRVTPNAVSRKCLEAVARKIELMRSSTIKLHITGVICNDTQDESEGVLNYGLERDIPTEVRLVHAGPDSVMRVDPAIRQRQLELLHTVRERKRAGEKVHTSDLILDYQAALVEGRTDEFEWTCSAGFKLFFVSAQGRFMECSMRPTDRHILDMTVEDLKSYYRKKDCQDGCGVYCVVSTSLYYEQPLHFVGREVAPRIRQTLADLTGRIRTPGAARQPATDTTRS